MTIKELAKAIAEDFNKSVVEAGSENFKEMKRMYDWDAKDIRAEVEYMADRLSGGSIAMLDDGQVINFEDREDEDCYCTYGQFKKMVFAEVK